MADGSNNVCNIEAVMGPSGSGKSYYVKQQIKRAKPKRLVVWDAREEYGDLATPVYSLKAVLEKLRSGKPVKIAFRPPGVVEEKELVALFSALCRIVFAAGHLTFVAEELSDVTTPSRAPGPWRKISTQGRHKGLHVYGCSQRPASIDKQFLGNATIVRTHRLNYHADRVALARFLDVPLDQVGGLAGYHYIERDMTTRAVKTG